jgi:hypothetical protein
MTAILQAALQYAELGYAVFPCAPGRKTPLTQHGFQEATTDSEQIERWWEQHPSANVAIATQGLVVIDIDGRENTWPAGDADRRLDLAKAPVSLTPSGGRHYVFRQPTGRSYRGTAGRLAPKVDTRSDGNYILVPPSVVGGKAYRWVEGLDLDIPPGRLPEPPAWLVAELDRLATTSPTSPRVADGAAEANPIPSGQRNATLARLAGTMRRVGMAQAEISAALNQVNLGRCAPPLSPAEVERIAQSVARYEPDQISTALAEDHWAQMRTPDAPPAGPPDPGPLPDHLLTVPGFVGDVMDFNLATAFRPQPALAMAAAITLLGTLTGRKVCDEMNTRTNVYCLGVCPSGGGKERARQINKEILFLAGAAQMVGPEGLASHAGLISAVENQPAILFQLDEVGRLLRTLADPSRSPHLYHIATNLMKLFTSSATVFIGDAYADQKRNKVIHQPHACVYGTTVPQSLYEGLTAENVTDGFLSRVMIFESAPERVPKRYPAIRPLPKEIVATARWWVELNPGGNLNGENPTPIVVVTTADAQARFDQLDIEAELAQQELGEPLGTLWTRATEKARKLALIYACSESMKDPAVADSPARWACELSRYLTRRLAYLASQWVAENPFDAKRKRLLRLISEAGPAGLTKSMLYGRTRALTGRERAEVLEALILCGDVVEAKEQTGGAPRSRYVAAVHAAGTSS